MVYINNILVYLDNLLEYKKYIKKILYVLQDTSLQFDIKKYEFEVIVLQDYGIKDRASAMHWRSSIGATFVYC
jgi:hypothetical protein